VDDQQLWNTGVFRLNNMLAGLPAPAVLTLTRILKRYRMAKEAYSSVVAEVDASVICCECGGQCCMNGKYRINVLDALARIAAEIPTCVDFSRKPVCPYGGDSGCMMEPGFRPLDCVLFICDALERKLSRQALLILAAEEQEQRKCISEASILTGEQVGTPLLLWAGRAQ